MLDKHPSLKFFFAGNKRSVKAKKNIIASFVIQGFNIIIGFLMVRIALDYLNPTKYGIWLTVSSLLAWVSFFDIGLGNGLRNKLAEAFAKQDYLLGRMYVSTTYAILSIIVVVIAVVFFIGNQFIDWTVILNTDTNLSSELSSLAAIVFGPYCLRFVMQTIGVILNADQRPALANAFGPAANLIALIGIYTLTKATCSSSLIYLGLILSITPIILMFFASIYFYNSDYKSIAPSIKNINFKYAKDLMSLGSKFFFIQIAALIVFQSSNLIISYFFGPAEVTPYNIAYKLFSVMNTVFAIIMMPFWSAFTDAWVKKDILWIKKVIRKLLWVWGGISAGGLLMLFLSDKIYLLWVGESISIPFMLSFSVFIYFVVFSFNNIYVMFLNGIGKLKLQMYGSFFAPIVFIVVVVSMIKVLKFGVISVVIASTIVSLYGLIIFPMQFHKIINDEAYGIWNE